MTRRPASTPSGSWAIRCGGAPNHQVTTGASGASSGSTTDSACRASRPYIRRTTASPGPSRPPMSTSASRRASAASGAAPHDDDQPAGVLGRGARRRLLGLLDLALLDDHDEGQREPARHRAGRPPLGRQRLDDGGAGGVPQRRHERASGTVPVCVPPARRAVTAASSAGRRGPASRRRRAGPTRRRGRGAAPASCSRQCCLDRVDDAPALLDLLVAGEQRRVAEQHVEQQPLVGLGAGLGERLAVLEVHRDVADLHRRAGHLGAEAQRHALVGLDPHDELVRAQLLGVGLGERQVRRLAEQHGDLGDPAGEPLAGAQVERDAGPAPGLDLEAHGGVGLGAAVLGDALLGAVGRDALAGQPALVVLAADGVVRRGRSAA